MAQKKVGFSKTGSVQADRLIVNNGLTASTTYNFYGLTAISFNLPVADGTSGQALKTDGNGNLSFGTVAVSSTSGTSGISGSSGTSGIDGTSGTSGQNGSSGTSGQNGSSGTTGTSGTSGTRGTSGTSGVNGTSGTSGANGSSGTSGANGSSGTSGTSGTRGTSGTSGVNGTSGTSGVNGTSGTSGANGSSGTSGTTGTSGTSGIVDALFIDGWLNTGSYSTQISALTASGNWTVGNTFSGSISSTYQGQRYFSFPYIYDAIDDNQWVRTAVYGTTGATGAAGTSGTSGVNGTSGTSGSAGTSGTSGANGVGNATILGTTNYIPKFTGATALGDSAIRETNSQLIIPDGTIGTPSIAFGTNTTLGFYKTSGLNEIYVALSGANMAFFGQNTSRFRDGSAAVPGIAFLNDTDTGMYRSGSNTIDFAAGGQRTFFITDGNINVLATASQNSIQFRTRNDGNIDFGIMNSNTGLQFNRYDSSGVFVDNALTISKPEGDGGVLFRDGSAATPSISFQNDTDTGLFRSAANEVSIASSATQIATFYRTGSTNILRILNAGSSQESNLVLESNNATRSAILFYRGSNTTSTFGIFQHGATGPASTRFRILNADTTTSVVNVAVAENASDTINFGSTTNPSSGYKLKITGKTETTDIIGATFGTVSAPAYSFVDDTDTGMYRVGANEVGISSAGVRALWISTNTTLFRDGSSTLPGISFQSDTNTGFYRPTTDQVGISTGGATAAIFGATNSMSVRTYFDKAVNHVPVVNASVTGLYTIDMSASNVFNLTLTGNTTLDYSNSYEGSYVLLITQDGTGGRTLGLTGGSKFIGATALSIATASNAKSIIQLIHVGTQSVVTYQSNLQAL